jgi:outer membrane protein assembly factor BamB
VVSGRTVSFRSWRGAIERVSRAEIERLAPGSYLLAFAGPVDASWRRAVESLGLSVLSAAPPYGLAVRGDGPALARLDSLRTSSGYAAVRGVRAIPLEARLDPALLRVSRGEEVSGLRRAHDGRVLVRIESFTGRTSAGIAERAGAQLSRGEADLFLVRAGEIAAILQREPDVAYVEAVHERTLHDNLALKSYMMNVEPIWTEPALSYDGTGVIVGHNDSGVDPSHPDLPPSAIVATAGAMSGTNNGHGTHTAGSVLGRGLAAPSPTNTFSCGDGTPPLPSVRGAAFGARLVTNNLFNGGFTTETTMMRWSYQQGARISTNSWGYVNLFTYSSQASVVDGLVRDADSIASGNQDFLIFFSAGNDGPGSATVGSPGTAKNVVTIGASQNDRCGAYVGSNPDIDTIANFSSRGPSQGRIKPDLVAPGTDVLSAQSSDPMATHPWDQSWTGSFYSTNTGTSMSTPLSAGAGAVFFEFYKDRFGSFPSPSLAKAALINGAVDLGLGYPSFHQGWGRLNLRNAIEGPPSGSIRFFDQTDVTPLPTGASYSRTFEVFSSGVPLKISLVWTDPPAPGGSTSPLVNNLDLVVTAPDSTVYRGNFFTGSWSTPNPGAANDTANNVENVFVRTPMVGTWSLSVSSAGTAVNPPNLPGQDFALVYSGDAADCFVPPAPTGLAATAIGANRIDLSWNPEPTATGYNIYRATTSGGPYVPLASVSSTSYSDLSASGGTTYYYTITSVSSGGCESTPSSEASALATGDCTLAPSFAGLGSVAPSGSSCSIDLSWSPAASNCPSAPVSYNVYRSTVANFTPSLTNLLDACVTGTSYQDTNVASATTYYYLVEAEDGTPSGGGICNGGNVDGNRIVKGGAVSLTPTTLYSNGFEGADDFLHALEPGGTTDSWRGIQTGCPSAGGAGIYRFGGASCSANYASNGFASAGPSSAFAVPAGALNVTLELDHRFELELDGNGVYDGGYIALSVDGSPYQPVGGARLSGAAYNAVIDGSCSSAVGAEVFSGTSPGYGSGSYVHTVVDLDGACDDVTGGSGGCSGRQVQFRFVGATDCVVNLDGWFLDNVSVTADLAGSCVALPDPVPFFTVTSTDARNDLEWLNPSSGGSLTITYRTDRFPASATDGSQLLPPAGTPGAHQAFPHAPVANGTTYYYAAFVGNGFGDYSSPRFATGMPKAAGNTLWAYHTSAAAVAPPAIGSVYAVSNDSILHSMTPAEGKWPAGWVPVALNAPAQSRPPVISIPLGGASKVLFAGAQDGHVYAIDADTGSEIWTSPQLGERVQAAPSGMFTAFTGAYDLIFAATRNSSSGNAVFGLRLADGLQAWRFDNLGGPAIGIISGSASVDYPAKRLIFASRSPSGGSPNTLWCIQFTDLSANFLWARALGDIDGSPILFGGKVYVGTNDSKVYVVDAATGADVWTTPFDAADGPVKGFVWPGFGTGELYFATTNTVWGLTDSGSSGTEKWRVTSIPSPSTPTFVPGTGKLLVGGGDGRLHQLDLTATPPTSKFEILGAGTAAAGPPSVDIRNGLVYVGTTLGAIYAVVFPLP